MLAPDHPLGVVPENDLGIGIVLRIQNVDCLMGIDGTEAALGQLLGEQGDNLELFADRREDEARLINFLAELDKENENA